MRRKNVWRAKGRQHEAEVNMNSNMSAAGPSQDANRAPSGGSAAAESTSEAASAARHEWPLGEWVGKGPVLEEDIALTNVGLDLLGQARLWFAYAGEIDAKTSAHGRTEDELAFLRDGSAFRNLLLTEQPNGSYADTMARQF